MWRVIKEAVAPHQKFIVSYYLVYLLLYEFHTVEKAWKMFSTGTVSSGYNYIILMAGLFY